MLRIAAWNENQDELRKPVLLPHAKNKKPVPLENIFERVLNYVIFHQCNSDNKYLKDFFPNGMTEDTLLLANKKYFELLNGKKIISTKQNISFAGHFSADDLENLLDSSAIENSICLISGIIRNLNVITGMHCISLGYKNGSWILYDPDYYHTSTNGHIYKKFNSKKELVSEIQSILGSTVSIHIATSDKNKKISHEYFHHLIKTKPLELADNLGLYMIARNADQHLGKILDAIINTPHGHEKLAKYLANGSNDGNTFKCLHLIIPGLWTRCLIILRRLTMVMTLSQSSSRRKEMAGLVFI